MVSWRLVSTSQGGFTMKQLVSDALWERLQPLLPPPPQRRFRFPGRKPLDYRKILTGILFVLKTGIAWDDLPAELGCGCGKTCHHYLRQWHQAGVWQRLHALLLAELNGADAHGIPLNATVTAANVNEVTQVLDVLVNKPAVGGKSGPKRELPDRLQGDTGYDSEPLRVLLRWLGITPVLGKRNREHGSGLGKFRWFAERTISWLHAFGRLRRRLDRLSEIQEAFLRIGCSLVCLRVLTP